MSEVVLQGATILTMDDRFSIVEGDVAIRDGRIVAVGGRYTPQTGTFDILDARDHLVMPGLVQGHVHSCQTLARGRADSQGLMPWLQDVIWPYEAALDPDAMRAAAELAYAEMLLSGTTAVMDMASVHHTDVVFEAAATLGIRATIGKALMDVAGPKVPPRLAQGTAEAIADATRLIDTWHGACDGRLRAALAPRFVLSCSDELLAAVSELATGRGICVHTHASENVDEIAHVRARFGSDNIACLGNLGLLGEHVVLAHCVHTSDDDLALLARTRTHVAHCPGSNLKLGSGIARIPEMLALGISVSLGCDGAPCNNTLDGFAEVRLAALLHRVGAGRTPLSLPPHAVLNMATRGGAAAMGLSAAIGSLEVGKRGDVIAIRRDSLHAVPAEDAVSQLAFSLQGHDVNHVVVDGHVVVRDQILLTADTALLVDRARKASQRLFPLR